MAKLNSGTRIYGNVTVDTFVTATGNVTGGNILTVGVISATGNIAGNFFIGNGSQLTGVVAASSYGNANVVANLAALGSNPISTTGNITGGNILGGANVNATTHTGTTVSVTANVTGGNILTAGLISATGNITGGNVLGGANVNATIHTGTTVSVTGNITGGNVLGGANVNAATHTGTTVSVTSTVTGSQFNGSGAGLTSIPAANVSGTVANATYATSAGSATTATSATTAGTVTTAAQPNITSVGTLTGLTINNATTAITNGAANGVGNIGTSANSFNTIFAKATSAQYADLAEMYVADADYLPGTVLEFGGKHEVTVSNSAGSVLIAGVVSTNPAHLMNSTAQGEYLAAIALVGRVPTLVVGPVFKGAMMVSAGNGYAQASATPAMGTVIGKAVEDFTGASGTIEIAVGRL